MILFIRLSKQWYWEANKAAGIEDDIIIGDMFDDGSARWEFLLKEYQFTDRMTAVRIEMFDEAVKALRVPKVVDAILSLEGYKTLDEAERRLAEHGIESKISTREKPKVPGRV